MKKEKIFTLLKSFVPPDDWSSHLFLLPEEAMHTIYDFIIDNKVHSCIELGTGFGTTCCVMAAAIEEIGGGRVVTVDKYLHQPVNAKVLMQHTGLSENLVDIVVDDLGYNWYLADLIRKQTQNGVCTPIFDFCLLDGAHEWEPDALAFLLVAKLLKPDRWIALDDVNFNLRMIPNLQETIFANYSDRELDTFQINMVYELVVLQHPDFYNFHLTHEERICWAKKRRPFAQTSLYKLLSSMANRFMK